MSVFHIIFASLFIGCFLFASFLAILLRNVSAQNKDRHIGEKLLLFLIFSIVFFMPSFIIKPTPYTEYRKPYSVLKTNDMVVIQYFVNKDICMVIRKDIAMWRSTNIVIKVEGGKNVWNMNLDNYFIEAK